MVNAAKEEREERGEIERGEIERGKNETENGNIGTEETAESERNGLVIEIGNENENGKDDTEEAEEKEFVLETRRLSKVQQIPLLKQKSVLVDRLVMVPDEKENEILEVKGTSSASENENIDDDLEMNTNILLGMDVIDDDGMTTIQASATDCLHPLEETTTLLRLGDDDLLLLWAVG